MLQVHLPCKLETKLFRMSINLWKVTKTCFFGDKYCHKWRMWCCFSDKYPYWLLSHTLDHMLNVQVLLVSPPFGITPILHSVAKLMESVPHDKQSLIEHLRECFTQSSTVTRLISTNWAPFNSGNLLQCSYGKKPTHFWVIHPNQWEFSSITPTLNLCRILVLSMQYMIKIHLLEWNGFNRFVKRECVWGHVLRYMYVDCLLCKRGHLLEYLQLSYYCLDM